MTDRITTIMGLSTLAASDTLRGDDRAVQTLRDAVELLLDDQSALAVLGVRRQKDRERKRANPPRIPQIPQISADSVEPPGFPPTPPFPTPQTNTTTTTPGAGARGSTESAEITSDVNRTLSTLADRVGADLMPDVQLFLDRRSRGTWGGWIAEMLRLSGPGSQFTPTDVAAVCRDDATLERPLASPMGFRTFISNARIERVRAAVGDAGQIPNAPRGQRMDKIAAGRANLAASMERRAGERERGEREPEEG